MNIKGYKNIDFFNKIITITLLLIILQILIFQNNTFAQGYLHTSGIKIVDGNNNEVNLKGLNLGNWLEPEGYMWQTNANSPTAIYNLVVNTVGQQNGTQFWNSYRQNYITKNDIDRIKAWGFNSIRLPFHYNLFTPKNTPYSYIQDGFNYVDSVLSWCTSDKIYLILDMHCALGGQNRDNISDYQGDPTLWQDTSYQNRTVALWQKIAQRYANQAWIGGYDLLNETVWDFSSNPTQFRNFFIQITNAIRLVDKNHIVFIEGNYYATDFSLLTPKWDNNMVYSFHKYWNATSQSTIQYLVDLRNAQQVPLWLGESGENVNTWYTDCIQLMNANDIGWCWWPLKKMNSNNCPLSINETSDYKTLLNEWNSNVTPNSQFAMTTLTGMIKNMQSFNCTFHPDVIDAIIRQPTTSVTIPFANNNIPGTVFASNYDMGQKGIAYQDADSINSGGQYRNDGVDIENCSDSFTNGYDVGWINSGEFLTFTINSFQTSLYNVNIRIASESTTGKILLRWDNQILSSIINIPNTNGWQTWQSLNGGNYNLTEGTHILRVDFFGNNFNLNYLDFETVTGINDNKSTIKTFEVKQNYPNPFNPSTKIEFQIPKEGFVSVRVYNVLGKEVATLLNGQISEGVHNLNFNTSELGLSSGVYFYDVIFNGVRSKMMKAILMK